MLGKKIKVLLLEDNPGDARLVREMLSEAPGAFELDNVVTLVAALDRLASQKYDVMLADLSVPDSQGLDTFTTLHVHSPGMPIVLLTGLASESVALQAVQGGAQDYLVKSDLSPEALVRALNYSVLRSGRTAEPAPAEPQLTRVIGIVSSTGGAGATTVACYFGMELYRQTRERVLLMDLDTNSSGASYLMRADAKRTILDATTGLQRLDEKQWKSLIVERAGMDLLPSPGAVGFGEQLSGERIRHVLRFARSLYKWILVDLCRLDAAALYLLAEIKDLLLVTTGDGPAFHEVRRIMAKLREAGLRREQIRLVLNRVSPEASAINRMQSSLASMGYPVAAALPDSPQQLGEAIGRGWPLGSIVGFEEPVEALVAGFAHASDRSPLPDEFGARRFAGRV